VALGAVGGEDLAAGHGVALPDGGHGAAEVELLGDVGGDQPALLSVEQHLPRPVVVRVAGGGHPPDAHHQIDIGHGDVGIAGQRRNRISGGSDATGPLGAVTGGALAGVDDAGPGPFGRGQLFGLGDRRPAELGHQRRDAGRDNDGPAEQCPVPARHRGADLSLR